jgi:D-glycero-D-manno-heptose 1,7-bisphosphate phosphatase
VATNQSGMARGLFDIKTLNAIHQKMHTLAQQVGADIEVFFCPHTRRRQLRLPQAQAGHVPRDRRFNISLRRATVGDSLRDLQAGRGGAAPFLVLTGKAKTQAKGGLPPGTLVFPDLSAVLISP